jgi:two-component system sensor histidine kinase CpxA
MAITVSGLLCFFLAWSFTRPIKELRDASQQMAKGNLQAGTSANIRRRDEIGDLSEDFRTMAVKVNELLDHQKRLLADISHELRSPLARLQLAIGIAQQNLENAQRVQDATGTDKTHRQVLERIEKEATQIDNMIARVLQLSRLESNTQDIIRNKVIFPSFIDNVMQDAEYEAQSTGKKLLQSHCPCIEVVIEPTLIASAVENVLRNAIRYAKTTVEVSSQVKDGLLLICVADDGCGVPGSELEKLFTPFYRVSLARNRESGGTGLGLAIAIQAINAHNGRISASNNKKGGLSVEIELPLLDS